MAERLTLFLGIFYMFCNNRQSSLAGEREFLCAGNYWKPINFPLNPLVLLLFGCSLLLAGRSMLLSEQFFFSYQGMSGLLGNDILLNRGP